MVNSPSSDCQGAPSISSQMSLLCSLKMCSLLISCNAINHGRFSWKQLCFHVLSHQFLLRYAKDMGMLLGVGQDHEERGELPFETALL